MQRSETLPAKDLLLPGELFGPEGDEPVYALPAQVIDHLCKPIGPRGRCWLSDDRAKAEHRFTEICNSENSIGYHACGPIQYHWLTRKSIELTSQITSSLGWTSAQIATLQNLDKEGAKTTCRLRGVAGWLLTEPAFLKDVDEVRQLYRQIPKECRPNFPLGRRGFLAGDESMSTSLFLEQLSSLLDRWGLIDLQAWDLPTPQGPLLPGSNPAKTVTSPPRGIHVFIPIHYPLKGDDEIQKKIEKFQQHAAKELGIDPSLAGLAHFETYERMFRLLHLERSIRRRFPDRPSGLVGAVEATAAKQLHLSVDRVKRLRKYIVWCQGGKRSMIKELSA